MSAPLPVQRIPRPAMPAEYDQATLEAAFQALERDLVARFTRKSDLALEPGKRLVLASTGGNVQYALGLQSEGKLTVTDYLTGIEGELIVDWAQVDGAAERDASIEALEAVAAGIPGTYATILYVDAVEATLEGSIATSASLLTTAFETADGVISAAVAVNSGAIATINENAAFYEILVAAGGGDPARISLKAGADGAVVLLDGDQIWFGEQTAFDTSTETFITEVGGVRSRYGTAFGNVASQVVMWHGPTSVAQGSETRTNGYLAIGTNGLIYHNAAALNWGATAAEAAASNVRVPAGTNMLLHSAFHVVAGFWEISSSVADTRSTGEANGIRYRQCQLNGTPAVGANTIIGSVYTANCLAVQPGQRVGVRALLGGISMATLRLAISWYNASGTNFQDSVIQDVTSGILAGGGNVASYNELLGVVDAPATAVFAKFYVRGFGNGGATPTLRLARPLMALLPAGQTTPPPWSPGFLAQPGADIYLNGAGTMVDWRGLPTNIGPGLASVSSGAVFSYPAIGQISINATTRTLAGQSISLPSATLTGLSNSTKYYIARDLVAGSYLSTTSFSTATTWLTDTTNRYLYIGSYTTRDGGGGGGGSGTGDISYVEP